MIINFQKRFVSDILAGSKRHTIRALRVNRPRVGEVCNCYTGLRQKGAQLLGRWPCVDVERIRIIKGRPVAIFIDGVELDLSEKEALARRDGFSNLIEMIRFWDGRLPFIGQIIHWDFDRPLYKNGNHYGLKRP